MTVREVTQDDADAWLAMRRALWPNGTADEHRADVEQFLDGVAPEPQAVLLAENESGPVGFAELSIRPYAEKCRTQRIAYLEGWYVVPDARRTGVGRALVRAAEQWGRAQGCKEFASDSQIDNDVSIRAHTAVGFRDAGVIRCFIKEL